MSTTALHLHLNNCKSGRLLQGTMPFRHGTIDFPDRGTGGPPVTSCRMVLHLLRSFSKLKHALPERLLQQTCAFQGIDPSKPLSCEGGEEGERVHCVLEMQKGQAVVVLVYPVHFPHFLFNVQVQTAVITAWGHTILFCVICCPQPKSHPTANCGTHSTN
jgi:hypothetical protein